MIFYSLNKTVTNKPFTASKNNNLLEDKYIKRLKSQSSDGRQFPISWLPVLKWSPHRSSNSQHVQHGHKTSNLLGICPLGDYFDPPYVAVVGDQIESVTSLLDNV